MHNKTFIYLFVFVLLVSSVLAADVSPTSWSIELVKGNSAFKEFVFSTTSNSSTSLSFSKTGTNTDYISLNLSTAPISNNNSVTLKATMSVPSSAIPGIYLMKILYESSEIPVILTINETGVTSSGSDSIAGCRLEPFPDTYTIPIVAGSPPLTQSFSLLVTKKCTEEVNIKQPIITGNTQTKDGLRPLNLFGGSKLGFIEPNKEGTFDVQIDSSGLPAGTYKPQILVNGIYKGEQLSAKISFTIEVRQGATPLEGITTLPTYLFSSSDLTLNNTYTITAQNLNPNFQPFIDQNEYIKGIKVDTSANGWTYSFTPIKVGNTKIRVSTYFSGAPIGDITEKDIRITYGSSSSIGTKMCMQFFLPSGKTIDTLSSGDEVTVLPRATNSADVECNSNDSSIISGVDIYKNGAKLDKNVFTVNAGEIITISASAPGFVSVDKVINIPLNTVAVSFSTINNDIELNSQVSISTNPNGASLTFDGSTINNSFVPTKEGTFKFTASKDGYKLYSADITVTPELAMITPEIPKSIKINQPYYLEFNKNAQWSVLYSEKQNSTQAVFKNGFSNKIEFMPDRNGFYKVYLRNKLVGDYKVGGLFGITIPKYFWYVLIAIIVIFIFFKFMSGNNSSKGEKMGAGYEFNIGEENQ